MTKKWLRERKRDYYHNLAKEQGYRSRAAYKLLQIAEKYQVIKSGNVVVDLGAAPGSWIQVARKLVGKEGYVLGIDLKPIKEFNWTNVTSVVSDIEKLERVDVLRRLPREPDILLSDLSPNVSGVWNLDHARQIHLSELSLKLAITILRMEGNILVKVFQGNFLKDFNDKVKKRFRVVKVVKPKATRKRSAELYIVGLKFKG